MCNYWDSFFMINNYIVVSFIVHMDKNMLYVYVDIM